MPGLKTNEIVGTRAVLRYCRMSAYKAREVLDVIRGEDVVRAADILRFSERDAALVIGKLLASAVANAQNNDGMEPEELYVATCYADEGATIKRWRPRARGRATRIRKRTCHITIIVSRLPEDRLERLRARQAADLSQRRARRVAGQREAEEARRRRTGRTAEDELAEDELAEDELPEDELAEDAVDQDETVATDEEATVEEAAVEEAPVTEAPGSQVEEEAAEVDAPAAATDEAPVDEDDDTAAAAGDAPPAAGDQDGEEV